MQYFFEKHDTGSKVSQIRYKFLLKSAQKQERRPDDELVNDEMMDLAPSSSTIPLPPPVSSSSYTSPPSSSTPLPPPPKKRKNYPTNLNARKSLQETADLLSDFKQHYKIDHAVASAIFENLGYHPPTIRSFIREVIQKNISFANFSSHSLMFDLVPEDEETQSGSVFETIPVVTDDKPFILQFCNKYAIQWSVPVKQLENICEKYFKWDKSHIIEFFQKNDPQTRFSKSMWSQFLKNAVYEYRRHCDFCKQLPTNTGSLSSTDFTLYWTFRLGYPPSFVFKLLQVVGSPLLLVPFFLAQTPFLTWSKHRESSILREFDRFCLSISSFSKINNLTKFKNFWTSRIGFHEDQIENLYKHFAPDIMSAMYWIADHFQFKFVKYSHAVFSYSSITPPYAPTKFSKTDRVLLNDIKYPKVHPLGDPIPSGDDLSLSIFGVQEEEYLCDPIPSTSSSLSASSASSASSSSPAPSPSTTIISENFASLEELEDKWKTWPLHESSWASYASKTNNDFDFIDKMLEARNIFFPKIGHEATEQLDEYFQFTKMNHYNWPSMKTYRPIIQNILGLDYQECGEFLQPFKYDAIQLIVYAQQCGDIPWNTTQKQAHLSLLKAGDFSIPPPTTNLPSKYNLTPHQLVTMTPYDKISHIKKMYPKCHYSTIRKVFKHFSQDYNRTIIFFLKHYNDKTYPAGNNLLEKLGLGGLDASAARAAQIKNMKGIDYKDFQSSANSLSSHLRSQLFPTPKFFSTHNFDWSFHMAFPGAKKVSFRGYRKGGMGFLKETFLEVDFEKHEIKTFKRKHSNPVVYPFNRFISGERSTQLLGPRNYIQLILYFRPKNITSNHVAIRDSVSVTLYFPQEMALFLQRHLYQRMSTYEYREDASDTVASQMPTEPTEPAEHTEPGVSIESTTQVVV